MTIFVLWVVMGTREWPWGTFDNPHSCAGSAAAERHAQSHVQMAGFDPKMKFICRSADG
jgi:hypothetical protein